MKRLTGYNKYGCVYAIGMGVKNNAKVINAILARLAAYEDTGLEPQVITETQEWMRPISFNRIREIMNAEAEGRLVVLPCKVRDTVYCIRKNPYAKGKYVKENKVLSITWDERFFILFTTKEDVLGKTVFLTREEAEEALRRKTNE